MTEVTNSDQYKEIEKSNSVSFDYEDIDIGNIDVGPSMSSLKGESLKKAVESRRKKLQLAINNPPNIRLKDKISFTLGVANLALTAFVAGKWPEYFYMLYTIKFPLLLGIRFYIYHHSKWHYFMLDFCYYANALFFSYLWFFNDSCTLFQLSFSFTIPLCWAIALWTNSLVFHSLDKITSLYIHLTPSLVVWCLRWFVHDPRFNVCENSDGTNNITFFNATLFPLLPYLFWQLLYFIKVQIFDRHKFKTNKQYTTSFLWLSTNDKNSLVYKCISIFGEKYLMYMFGVFQFVYTFMTMLAVKIFYDFFWAHTLFLITIAMISAWNGSTFYIEVFSKKYQSSMIEMEQHYTQLSKTLGKMNKEQSNEKNKEI